MSKKGIKKYNKKKTVIILLEYILTIICVALIFLLIQDNIDSNTYIDENGVRWNYSIENGNAINIYYHSGKLSDSVKIPENIKGYPVTHIGNVEANKNIFNSTKNDIVNKIIVPDSIKTIGEASFKNCKLLQKIELTNNIINIERGAFEGCSSLKEIELPENITELKSAIFQDCTNLESIKLPEKMEVIGDNAFTNCFRLEKLNIPDNLTVVGESAFANCMNLAEIRIPKKIQRIGHNTFMSCESLEKIDIPNGVLSIGSDAFNGCKSLKQIELPNSITTIGMETFMNCELLESITLPRYLDAIEKSCFYNCKNLKEIKIGDDIEKIEVQAFAGCESLTNINISSNVKEIGSYAFYGCDKLEQINIDKRNKNYIFENGMIFTKDKTELICNIQNKENNLKIPDSVITIKRGAFRGNDLLNKVIIGKNIQQIEEFAFANCNNLADIYIENKKENILFSNGWNLNTYAYIHDSDCKHIVEQISQKEDKENKISTEIKCGNMHTFKVNGNTQNMKVRVISEGQYYNSNKVSEIIYPNEDGIYVIEGINRNIKILLQSKNDAGGVNIRYVDGTGNDIEQSEYIEGKIGEKYNIIPKIIEGFGIIKDGSINKDGIFTDDLITVTFTYQKVNRLEINLLEGQNILLYIIVILSTILLNLIIYIIVDRNKS